MDDDCDNLTPDLVFERDDFFLVVEFTTTKSDVMQHYVQARLIKRTNYFQTLVNRMNPKPIIYVILVCWGK